MDKFFAEVKDTRGEAVLGALVTVTDYDTGALSVIYADDETTRLTNPFPTDALGRFSFCAADGTYNVACHKGYQLLRTLNHVVLFGI